MKFEKKVSIITATFNSCKDILETYESICQQTYSNWEWLVTDDASTDETLKVLHQLALKDERVKVSVLQENSGAAVARNNSLLQADGDYIAFIDSDDLWDRKKLELQINFMGVNSVHFSFTPYKLIDEKGYQLGKVIDEGKQGLYTYRDFLMKKSTFGCSTVILNRVAFTLISMPVLRTGQDYATWLKLLRTNDIEGAYCFPKPLTCYRLRSDSISANKMKKAKRQWQIYREFEGLGFVSSCYYFINYAVRAVLQRVRN